MSQDKIQKADTQDLSLVVRAIGADLEHTQIHLIASANADMLFHYWKVGHFILYLQKKEGWGSKVIDNLSKAIRSKYPDKKRVFSQKPLLYVPIRQCLSVGGAERNGQSRWLAQNPYGRKCFELDK